MAGEIIQGLDVRDILDYVGRKNKKYVAILLHDLEEVVPTDTADYPRIRKIVLDSFNSYTRSIIRVIFGDDFE